MSNEQRLPEIDDLIQDIIDISIAEIHTGLPGRVTGADHAAGKFTIQLEDKIKLNGVEVSRAPLHDVPIGFFRAGGFRITLPVQVGDKVNVLFHERATDDWSETGNESFPRFKRRHSLSDAYALPQAYSFNDPTPIDANDAVIGLENGNGEIRIKPDGEVVVKGTSVKLGSDSASESVVLGDKQKIELDKDFTAMSTLRSAITAWVPIPLDGGAALKVALASFLGLPSSSTAGTLSAKVDAE